MLLKSWVASKSAALEFGISYCNRVQFTTQACNSFETDDPVRLARVHETTVPVRPNSKSLHSMNHPRPALCIGAKYVPVLMALLLLSACSRAESNGSSSEGADENGIAAVEVVRAVSGALPLEKRFTGTVRARNQVVIYSEIAAPVLRVAAENGDYVQEGQPLVYLRDTEYREQLSQAEASLQVAVAESNQSEAVLTELQGRLARTEELAERQFQSEQELQAIQAQVNAAAASHQQALARIEQARATVEERQEALRRTVVRAPISGHVGQRNVEVGMRVDSGTQLYTIGDLSNVRVTVAVSDEILGQIEPGQTALVSAPTLGERMIRAEISRISPFLQAGSFSADAQIDVPNDEGLLRPGMFVTVDVHYGESQQATLIPLAALYEDPNSGAIGVYTAPLLGEEVPVEMPETFDADNPPPTSEPTRVSFQRVTVLAEGREMAGVQGVQVGEWVVTVGQNLLTNQQNEDVQARARPVPWERVVNLQRLQDQDLLREFMRRQQEAAGNPDGAESTDGAAPDSAAGQSSSTS